MTSFRRESPLGGAPYGHQQKTALTYLSGVAGLSRSLDFVSELNSNPLFRTLIPIPDKRTKYWARVNGGYSLLEIFYAMFEPSVLETCFNALIYDEGRWSTEWSCIDVDPDLTKLQYLCEFEKSKQELQRKRSDNTKQGHSRKKGGAVLVQKQSTGMFFVASPAFETRVHSITFCTRTCEKASKCDTVNFNPSTGACIGYVHDINHEYENTPEWEIWSFVVKSVDVGFR